MAAPSVSAGNHGDGPQNVKTGDGPQNNNNDKGLQINNSVFHGFGINDSNTDVATMLQQEKEACLRSLSFEYMDTRKEDISLAHPETCDWFFETSQFQQWHRRDNLQNHNGVLWIKGHPGAGKSTLMKHTLRHLEKNCSGTHTIAAHFFNARGDYSEQTPLSMLRSLLYQLLEKEPSIYEQFVPSFREKVQKFKTKWKWRESDLKNFLLSEIQHYQSKPLIVLVDALDECEKPHVREVVGLLEILSLEATRAGVSLNICLSSRHYPHISMRKHLQLVVEETSEHNEDIVLYTRDNLVIEDKEIEEELLEKASGVFMWAVLVIKLLNKAYDEGRIEAMQDTLHNVPRDLEQVFEALLIKDNPDKHETIFMLQFVLLARRLLKPEELYFAVLTKKNPGKIEAWDQSKITMDDMRRRITNSSRGLIEVRKGEEDAVQFIHKSVNDFLIRNQRLQRLDPDLEINALGSSHECLRSCCMTYIMMEPFQSATDRKQVKVPGSSYPFLEYASIYIFAHAEEADKQQIGQAKFLQRLLDEPNTLERLRFFHNAFEEDPDSKCARGVSLLYMLAFYGYTRLTKALLDKKVNINAQGGPFGYALQAAVLEDNKEIVEMLLEAGADVNAQGGLFGYALQAAAGDGNEEIIEILLKAGADVNAQGGIYGYALQAAAEEGNKEIVEILLKAGADVNAQGGAYGSALQAAALEGEDEIVELLLKAGADVNAQGGIYGSALHVAAFEGKEKIVELLLKEGADVNAQGGPYGSALCVAAAKDDDEIVETLLEAGADVNAQGGLFGNALCAAAAEGGEDIIEILLEAGADVNAQGGPYGNALCAAAIKGKANAVQLLLDKGADVNSKTEIYGNAFQAARVQGNEEIMNLLIKAGADANPPESYFNPRTRADITPRTEGQLLEMVLKQRVHGSPTTQKALRVFFERCVRKTIYKETMEILFKENIRANNQWIYDYFCWLVIESENADDAARLAEKGANPNAYREGFPIGLIAAMFFNAEEAAAVLLDKGVDINPMFYTETQMHEPQPYRYLAWLGLGMFSTLFILWGYFSDMF
ncbi:hypothetical protein MKX08_007930 [Trichoderma sp. CBMAI-0020]|nr:hypothetical protein MKX08_007930 [Trichoderma sp. CBMAI-0020]